VRDPQSTPAQEDRVFKQRIGSAALAAAATFTLAAAGAGPAAAQSCPHSSTQTVSGSPSYTYTRGCIVSFDGTPIVYNLFEPLNPAPRSVYPIMEGPGWGSAGDTTPDENLIAQGYAELTWDPRGFGQSGGVAEVDAPYAEGRDASALIDKVLTGRPEIAIDQCDDSGSQPHYTNDLPLSNSCGEPVVGMTGGSYGGGIQFATAAYDNRVKAIVPVITWNNLNYSLWPGNVIKLGWGELLYGAGLAEQAAEHVPADVNLGALEAGNPSLGGDGGMQIGGYDPMIHYSEVTGGSLGYPDRTTLYWFGQRSQAVYGAGSQGHIGDVPTLLIQGTVDTLFNLNDAWANYQEITGKYPGLPVKMIAFCGGHVSCPTGAPPTGAGYSDTSSSTNAIAPNTSAGAFDEDRTLDWFNHYLRGSDVSRPGVAADGMPDNVVYQDQNGNYYAQPTFPTPGDPGNATYKSQSFSGTVVAHGAPTGVGPAGEDAAVTDGATNSSDPGQLTVPVIKSGAADVPIVGIGHVTGSVSVAGAATELFFRLVDKNTGEVVDLQTQPCRVDNLDLQDLGGGSPGRGWAGGGSSAGPYCTASSIDLDLAGTAYDLPPNDELDLQVSTSTDSFSGNRGSSAVTLSNATVSVPTLAAEG